MIIVSICCFYSCQHNNESKSATKQKNETSIIVNSKSETSTPEETTSTEETKSEALNNEFAFNTVADLRKAIKYDPYKYYDAEIQVKGTLCKSDGGEITALVDLTEPLPTDRYGVEFRYEVRNNPNIDIVIADEVLYTVAENGDYMTVCGVVKIVNGEIYLDNCEYSFIQE